MTEDKEKDSYIRFRIDTETKEVFQELCQQKAINSSMLIRQLITQWIKEQQQVKTRQRKTDLK